mmetsp:Transcript_32357/g.28651  ORF Transcript_32357/g.28651 Transcript_32357/m.28651 type:complete len:87 (+) Transcript_32357:32-292(+)
MNKFYSEFKSYLKFKQETGFEVDGLTKHKRSLNKRERALTPQSGRSEQYDEVQQTPEKKFLDSVEINKYLSPSLNKLKIKKVRHDL